MPVTVDIEGLAATLQKLQQISDQMTSAKRRSILRKAAKPVRERSISLAPRSRMTHYRYKTPKLARGRRAKRGSALSYRIAYHPGNLKKSLQILTFRRDRSGVYVGPKRGGIGADHGRTVKSADGYYAQMVFGSASAFGGRVTSLALSSSSSQVRAIIDDQIKKYIKELRIKTGL